jgi:hypothetical protein
MEGHLPRQHLVHDDGVAVHVRRSAQPVLRHQLQAAHTTAAAADTHAGKHTPRTSTKRVLQAAIVCV